MNRLICTLASALLLVAATAEGPTAQTPPETRLLRFPAIHGNQIVFSYAGDLYAVAATGGTARRLTSDIGYEMFPRFSPDGRWLAFTGQYDGNTEVYLMPAYGGTPKRLTWTATLERDDVSDRMGPNNIVIGWKGNDRVLFRSRRTEWNDFRGQLYVASVNGGPIEELPLPRGGFASYSPDGRKLAYNRVFREFRTWKRYRGGQADEVWIHDFGTKETKKITDDPAQDIIPMWHGNRVYFASDRGEPKRMNIYVQDLGTKEPPRKLTTFTEFDVKFPSIGDGAIVFENGGYIYRLDLKTEKAEKVPISVAEDLDSARGGVVDVSRTISNYEIAPDGNRALFGARGDLFTVPVKHGNTRNLSGTSGVHERDSKWSPDGRWISYVSDATGEDEIYVRPQDGNGAPIQLTKNADTYKYAPVWSPDSTKLLWSDKKLRLQYVDVESKAVTPVAEATAFEITNYAWSPDSKWIAYAKPEEAAMTTIYLYSVAGRKADAVTDGWYSSFAPAFSSDGKFLFFVSNRSFAPTYGQTEFQHVYLDMSRIYLLSLAKDTKSPFAPRSDEVKIEAPSPDVRTPPLPGPPKETLPPKKPAPPSEAEKAEAAKAEQAKEQARTGESQAPAKPVPDVKVDLDGLKDRIAVLPTPASGYSSLTSVGNTLYYQRRGSRDERATLFMYDLEKQAETDLGQVNGFEVSANQKKMLVSVEGGYAIIDLPSRKIEVGGKLDLSNMKVRLDRQAEWRQIFNESWRQMRDFFYAPNMHGLDWAAVRKTYEPLVDHVSHRADLTYVIGEMISELSAGHAYVGGGDLPRVPRVQMGLLGARLERDPQSKAFRIVEILPGQNWDPRLRSPLTDIGVDVREGEYIVAVNGRPAAELSDIYEALVDTANKQVTLRVNAKPAAEGGRDVVVVPTADERGLYYFDWVETNVEKVSKATGGRVGYIHVPDMGVPGLNEFAKYYYPQLRKQGLIVDVRGNGGGNVSPMLIERLRREIAMVDIGRNTAPSIDPGGLVLGPKVALADEFSASDGDLFAYRFKRYTLGPVVGKRTWGGIVGIRGTLPFVDGGVLNRPEFASYDAEGRQWIIEGVGVEPDIFVDNDPAKEYAGEDQQLDKAVELVLLAMKEEAAALPPPPPYPVKK